VHTYKMEKVTLGTSDTAYDLQTTAP
jgi:hypothetical protein